jgi:hypothetical protein
VKADRPGGPERTGAGGRFKRLGRSLAKASRGRPEANVAAIDPSRPERPVPDVPEGYYRDSSGRIHVLL